MHLGLTWGLGRWSYLFTILRCPCPKYENSFLILSTYSWHLVRQWTLMMKIYAFLFSCHLPGSCLDNNNVKIITKMEAFYHLLIARQLRPWSSMPVMENSSLLFSFEIGGKWPPFISSLVFITCLDAKSTNIRDHFYILDYGHLDFRYVKLPLYTSNS